MEMGSENENIFRHIQNALIYSWAGLKAAWDNEMAFRTEVVVIALLMPIGIWIGETAVQWALLIGDRIGTEHHILSKQAKDLGSAAAGVSMLTAVVVWGLIAYERFLH
jgi:diacylglycerol kinase (ATP)